MCGIAGILSPPHTLDERREKISRMMPCVRPRGPDSEGIIEIEALTLGHTRLAILDLQSRAGQPMHSSDGRLTIAYNGEVYNFRALREELVERGFEFRTTSDTEVVLLAYACWGVESLSRLNGMFAFALYDRETHQLVLARDRFGKKPLFFASLDNSLIFGSTVSAVAAALEKTHLDSAVLKEYLLCGYRMSHDSVVKGVTAVPPGTMNLWEVQSERLSFLRAVQYWNSTQELLSSSVTYPNNLSITEGFEKTLEAAVSDRLVSDRPIGVLLSGGIDSAVVSAFASRIGGKSDLTAFCLGFPEAHFDETEAANRTAKYLGIKLVTERMPSVTLDLVDEMIDSLGEPLGDSSYLAMFYLSKFVKRHVDVVLSGDGGDETFAGYPTYSATYLARNPVLRLVFVRFIMRQFGALSDRPDTKVSFSYKLRAFATGAAYNFPLRHFAWRLLADKETQSMICHHSGKSSDADPMDVLSKHLSEISNASYLRNAQLVDFQTWLPNDILPKIDMSSMAHGLEVRSPFLDDRVVRFAFSLPDSQLFRFGRGKWILRQLARDLIPAEILRGPKRGFNSPVNVWLRGVMYPHASRLFSQANELTEGLYDSQALLNLLEKHRNGREDRGYLLWSSFVLLRWIERHLSL